MNRRRLIVVLEEQIFVYDISNMKLLHTIDTNPNPQGKMHKKKAILAILILIIIYQAICALSPLSENCFIAYPAHTTPSSFSPGGPNSLYISGDVELFDALESQTTNIIQAHKSPVSCISMNNSGTLLATASEKVFEYNKYKYKYNII
jgi:autophagy-related protein 18